MVERPKHIDRALVAIERTAETFESTLLYADVQVVRGYIARLERRIGEWDRPTRWRRIRQAWVDFWAAVDADAFERRRQRYQGRDWLEGGR